jgi:RNA polymerase sigma-70 factor (ECF subfamily)
MTDISGILRQEELLQMISELPDGYRAVFNMYVFEDFSHKEIADILGCTENTSKSQLHKARAMLKKKVVAAVEKQAVRT